MNQYATAAAFKQAFRLRFPSPRSRGPRRTPVWPRRTSCAGQISRPLHAPSKRS